MTLPENLDLRIKEIIVERLFLSEDPSEISSSAVLAEEYGVDSVSLLEMVVGLEEEFGIMIDPDSFDPSAFRTVSDICRFVKNNT